MKIELTPQQEKQRAEFRTFADTEIIPYAQQYDQQEKLFPEIINKLAQNGYLAADMPKDYGGMGLDMITFGLLCEEIGRGYTSARSLITVQSMVAQPILKFGNADQKHYWLPKLTSGQKIAAFALTEPNVGSDAKNIETVATPTGNTYVLNGTKKWITCGQIADLFLIIAQSEGQVSAFLVERDTPGFSTEPICGLLGDRGAMLAELQLNNCIVPKENLLGKEGFGFSFVANSALDHGRYSVSWGCIGIAQACLEASIQYSSTRMQFGSYIKDHQLIRQLISDMITQIHAARLLCYQAGYKKDVGDLDSIMDTLIAKYFASTMVNKVANDAVMIHGANGVGSEYPVQRYLRDAKIMQIIEGTTQMQQIMIAKYGYQKYMPVTNFRAVKQPN